MTGSRRVRRGIRSRVSRRQHDHKVHCDGYRITRPQGRDDADFRRSGQGGAGDGDRGRPVPRAAVRTVERDGYEAVQLGFVDKPRRLASRSERGHVAKLDSKRSKKRSRRPASSCSPRPTASRKRFVREFRGPAGGYRGRPEARRSMPFAEVKRGRRHRHQQGPRHRRRHEAAQLPGPAGHARREEGASPRRLAPARARSPAACSRASRWPASYGNERSTMRNSKLVRVDAENNLLLVRGAVPGPNGGYVIIQRNEHSCKSQLHVGGRVACSSDRSARTTNS